MNTKSKLVILELIGGIFGWIWIISSLAGIYFFISALFFEGLWTSFFWAFGTGGVAKLLARGFEANKKRVASEAAEISNRKSPDGVADAPHAFSTKEIIQDFAAFVENNSFSNEILDVKLLPHSKVEIFNSFVSEFNSSNPNFDRNDLSVLFLSLPHFQENVGDEPISQLGVDLSTPDFSKMDADEKSAAVKSLANSIVNNSNKDLYNKLWPLVEKELVEYEKLVN
mgnify:CR=1 FL=1